MKKRVEETPERAETPAPGKVRVRVKEGARIKIGRDPQTKTERFAKGGDWIEVHEKDLFFSPLGRPSALRQSVLTEAEATAADERAAIIESREKLPAVPREDPEFRALKRAAIEHREANRRAIEAEAKDVARSTLEQLGR